MSTDQSGAERGSSPGGIVAPALAPVLTLAVAAVHWLLNPRFFYWDDMQHAVMPVFRTIGARLVGGDWPNISLLSWQSGNLIGEGQYQLFNPVSLALFPIVAATDDLALGAAIYSTTYLLIAAAGAHFLAARAGAAPYFAAAAGLAYATSPFLLYWLGGSWTNGLASMAFLPWALGSIAGRSLTTPAALGIFLAGYAIAVCGWIHGLFAWLLLGGLALFERRRLWTGGQLVAAGLAALGGLLAALPQLLATLDAVRAGSRISSVSNLGMLTTEPQALVAGSVLPAFFDRLHWGSVADMLAGGAVPSPPVAYCAWFAIPAIAAAIRFRTDGGRARWLLIGALALGALMLGPDQLGPMRWPLRLMPAFCLALATWAAVQLTASSGADGEARRLSVLIVACCALLAWQQSPDRWLEITAWSVLIGLACHAVTTTVFLDRRRQRRVEPGLVVLLMTAVVPVGFAIAWPANHNLSDWRAPSAAAEVAPSPAPPLGSTLLVYSYAGGAPSREAMRQLPSGNIGMLSGQRYVNGYSPVEPAGLKRLLCSDLFGWTCGLLLPGLFQTVAETDTALVDLMRIDAIRVGVPFEAAASWLEATPGWSISGKTAQATTYSRTVAASRPGTVSFLGEGVEHQGTVTVTDDLEIHRLKTDGRSVNPLVVFARAWYPGYVARWNGRPIEVFALADVLAAVRLPDGAGEGRLEIGYSAFSRPAAVAAPLAGALLFVACVHLLRRRRQDL